MANALTEQTGYWNMPNYVGELFIVGDKKTPLLNAIGATIKANTGGLGRTVSDFEFVLSNSAALENGSQPAITETDSQTAPASDTYVPAQIKSCVQIFQRTVNMTYAKMSGRDKLSGLSIHGEPLAINDHYAFQVEMTLAQIAKDYEYSIINGTYNLATAANEAWKMRGLIQAVTAGSMVENAAGAALSKTMIDTLLAAMAPTAPLKNMVMLCNAFQRQAISRLYAYAPDSRNVGGVAIEQVLTDFCTLGVMYVPQMPTTAILFVDMDYLKPVALPVPGKGVLFKEPLAKVGAAEKEQIYGQLGIDYYSPNFHGIIHTLKNTL